jgi:hypothetical protein
MSAAERECVLGRTLSQAALSVELRVAERRAERRIPRRMTRDGQRTEWRSPAWQVSRSHEGSIEGAFR